MPGRCPLCGQALPHAFNSDELKSRIQKLATPALAIEKKKLSQEFESRLGTEIQKAERAAQRQYERELRAATEGARIAAKRDFDKQLKSVRRDAENRMKLTQSMKVKSAQNDTKLAKLQSDRARDRLRYEAESARLQGKLDDLSRKLEKQSGEQYGSEAELDLFTNLRQAFPHDHIQRIARGVKGADILHGIVEGTKVVGRVVYESKNTTKWQPGFIAQAKKYQSQYETPNVIVVSRVFPPKQKGFCIVKGIPVVATQMAVPLATVVREGVIEIAKLRLSGTQSNEKSLELYKYIVGDKFCMRFREMSECIESLRDFQQKERTWHENVWHTESTIHDRIASRHREVDAHIRTIVGGTPHYESSKLSARSEPWRELGRGTSKPARRGLRVG
jgi:hypothetical protein